MSTFCSLTLLLNRFLNFRFSRSGLSSSTVDLGDGTIMHCWIPKARDETKSTVVFIHGIGPNATWQWANIVPGLTSQFNVYVPDLVFFGDSYTRKPERSEAFQAQCVMSLMDGYGVGTMDLVGFSYGGLVAYSMAAQFKEKIEKVVLVSAGVSWEEKDTEENGLKLKNADEAVSIMFPQTPAKMNELFQLALYKPPAWIPGWYARDFIRVMCTEHLEERRGELIETMHNNRKLSDIPKITQPTRMIWGENDKIFPLELAHRLKRHVGENAELVIIEKAGHIVTGEKPKEVVNHIVSFLVPPLNHSNSG